MYRSLIKSGKANCGMILTQVLTPDGIWIHDFCKKSSANKHGIPPQMKEKLQPYSHHPLPRWPTKCSRNTHPLLAYTVNQQLEARSDNRLFFQGKPFGVQSQVIWLDLVHLLGHSKAINTSPLLPNPSL